MNQDDHDARFAELEMKVAFMDDRIDKLEAALLDKEKALAKVEADLEVALRAIRKLAGKGGSPDDENQPAG